MKAVIMIVMIAFSLGFVTSVLAQCGTCEQNYHEAIRIRTLMEPQIEKVNAGYRGTLGAHAYQKSVDDLESCIREVCSGYGLTQALVHVEWIKKNLWIYSGQPRIWKH